MRPIRGSYFHQMKLFINIFTCFYFIFLVIFATSSFAAQEQVSITTFYPAPNGIYIELKSNQLAVGSTYRNVSLSDGTLLVSTKVGIGTTSPEAPLHVVGNAVITGNVGIGTTSPAMKLDVAGGVKIGSTNAACNSATAGTLRWNTTTKLFENCDGTAWTPPPVDCTCVGSSSSWSSGTSPCWTSYSGSNAVFPHCGQMCTPAGWKDMAPCGSYY